MGCDLRDCQLPARAANRFPDRTGVKELKAVTESGSLPDDSQNFDLSEGKSEFQAHDLAYRNLIDDQRGNTGFAYVHGVSAKYGTVPRVDADVHVEGESWGSALFDEFAGGAGSELAVNFQVALRGKLPVSPSWSVSGVALPAQDPTGHNGPEGRIGKGARKLYRLINPWFYRLCPGIRPETGARRCDGGASPALS